VEEYNCRPSAVIQIHLRFEEIDVVFFGFHQILEQYS
jgi:hypothetical protein